VGQAHLRVPVQQPEQPDQFLASAHLNVYSGRMRRKKVRHQPGTMKLNQHTDGNYSTSVMLHLGRVTRRYIGPQTTEPEMSVDIFKSAVKDYKDAAQRA